MDDIIDEGDETLDGEGGANPVTPTLPVDRSGGLDIATLLQGMNTGAQGRATPSYAGEMANSRNRISRILERSLRNMESDKGYGRIGAALSQDISSGGKVPYAVASEQLKGREVGQAVNLSNAITGLSKMGGGGDMRQMANMLQRRTEQASRQGNHKAQRIEAMVKAASNGFDDSAMAQASMYAFLAKKQKDNPNLDVNELPSLMSEAIMDARRQGLGRRVAGRGRGAGGSTLAGGSELPMGDDGTPDYEQRIAKPKTAWDRAYNSQTPESRKLMHDTQTAKLTGKGKGGGLTVTTNPDGTTTVEVGTGNATTDAKNIDKFEQSDIEARSVVRTMDRIRGDLDKYGANTVGWLGQAGGFLSDIRAQVTALLKDTDETGAPRASAALRNKFGDIEAWDALLPTFVKTGPNAQVMQARFITLAYALASAREPGGRLTEQDVARAMKSLGATGGNPVSIRMVLDDSEAEMTERMRDRQVRSTKYSKSAPWNPRSARPNAQKVEPKDDPLGIFQ